MWFPLLPIYEDLYSDNLTLNKDSLRRIPSNSDFKIVEIMTNVIFSVTTIYDTIREGVRPNYNQSDVGQMQGISNDQKFSKRVQPLHYYWKL